ncbi:ATP phosphoribosyltransferase regulatory subunit [Peribacillus tepidiphilus]|uniref:ATP phosphoribosyltransferase regulatory subunit n=1 Tax=Peribacillus tepidiphilus TaxID=2652445 RepID=UPI001CDD22D1|nr:ATP phosphoribosyltransferase regulatory subunit [Peribacillus tepidiphilus]
MSVTKLFMFEKPLGMRDTLPVLYEAKMNTRNRMMKEIQGWGFQFLETPALEYYETVGEASAILDQQLFKLLDQQGHTLVLRPDMTAPIARVAAAKLLKQHSPLRLAYSANVYRAQQREGGRPAEFEQIGVECIGDPTISADAETITLLASALEKAGLQHFQISLGHIGFVQDVFINILGNEERASICRKFLYEKNYVGYREHVKSLPLSSIDKGRLLQLLTLRGRENVLEKAEGLLEENQGKQALNQLKELWQQLKEYDVEHFVTFDLTLVSHMSYYTGILFEIYANNIGFPIGNGGRYDRLFEKFGWNSPATGFAIRIDRLLEALGEPESLQPISCILFSLERKKEAILTAKEMRSEGKRVVLQDINGVSDLDLFTKSYAQVEYFLGTRKEES